MRHDTVMALQERRNGSLRKLALRLGFAESFATTLSDVLRGRHDHVSLRTENRLRVALGMTPIVQQMIAVPTCPDCGLIHTGRCEGKPVVRVVVLSEGEAVAPVARIAPVGARIVEAPRSKPRKRQLRRQVQVSPETHALLMAARQPGESADATIRRLLDGQGEGA